MPMLVLKAMYTVCVCILCCTVCQCVCTHVCMDVHMHVDVHVCNMYNNVRICITHAHVAVTGRKRTLFHFKWANSQSLVVAV